MRKTNRLAWTLLAALAAPGSALAQFAGDIFFTRPSVSVPAGGTGELELALFSAASPFGVAEVELSYDPAAVEIVNVVLPPNAGAVLRQQVASEPGLTRLVVVNTSSLSEPIGTVILAALTVRPLSGVGNVIDISADQAGALNTAAEAYPNSNGANGEVVVTAAAAKSLARGEARHLENPSAALLARARRLVPAGGWVELVQLDRNGLPQRVKVQAPPAPGVAGD